MVHRSGSALVRAFVRSRLPATLGWVAVLLALSACGDDHHGGGGGGGAPASKTGPTLDPVAGITSEPVVEISGKALKSDSTILIEGGLPALEVPLQKGKKFSATVPLKPNAVNHLLVTEVFSSGVLSPGVPLAVTQDSQEPKLFIDFPLPGEVLSAGTTMVAGRVSDLLAGFMGLQVTVNGQPAQVNAGIGTNGSFTIADVFLAEGVPTTITAVATDTVGNTATKSIDVTYVPPVGQILTSLSGDGQSAAIGELLPLPILVEVSHADGSPFSGKVVTFDVIKSNGRLTPDGVGDGALTLTAMTDRQGIAQAYWRVGSDAGFGNNRVAVSSNDIAGKVYFCASAEPGPPKQINVGTGGNQVAQVTGPAPEPLRVWVSDGCNGVEGMPVTFTVTKGTGTLTGGGKFNKSSVTVDTSLTGHAEALLTLGGEPGNTEVRANYPDSGVPDAVFVVLGLATEQDVTSFVGQVFDNAMVPIGGATCTLHVGSEPPLVAITDVNGAFLIDGIPSAGMADLIVDGATATTLGGAPIDPQVLRFPELHYEPVVIAHAQNTLTRPVLLPALDPVNDREYDGSADVELTLAGMEGLRMIVKAGSVTLLDGSHPTPEDPLDEPITLALNQVHHDDVPMPMPDGANPPFAWTLQPGGIMFDPPVKIIYPNMTGLPAGAVSYFLSFNHDTGRFEIVASGRVDDEGAFIETDEGQGISVAGWGCNCPPYSVTTDCKNCELEITAPAPGDSAPRFIDASPKMPVEVLRARVKKLSSGTVSFAWTYKAEFKGDGAACSTTKTWSATTTAVGSAETSWTVPFGNEIYGGKVTIKVVATLPNGKSCSLQISPYEIRGTNPSCAVVLSTIGGAPWYLQQIAKHESGLKQFTSAGMPLLSSAGDCGGGIFQVTPRSASDLWNWKANIQSGATIIGDKISIAESFWADQVEQWEQWNTDNPTQTVPEPAETTYGNATFSLSPTSGEHSYADALAIKCFNGCAVHFLVWKNNGLDPGQLPFWKFDVGPNNYVEKVCLEDPSCN
jgi:hypothetical protein